MVTITVAAILLAIAIPSFRDFTISNRLNTGATGLVTAIDSARMTAIKRNANTQFCSNDATLNTSTDALAEACTAAGIHTGEVYEPPRTVGGKPELVQAVSNRHDLSTFLNNNSRTVQALRCNSQGVCASASRPTLPFAGTVAVLCSSELSANNIYTVLMTGGSVMRIVKSSGATCPP
jgi:type IV fimbrial biogenesis protein FimT